jgi:hydroxypyruvate isomerase
MPMPRFAANLSLMYGEWPFEQRFGAAAEDGFAGVECQFPYEWPAAALAAARADAGVEMVLMNAPPGDAAAGERGLAALPGRGDDFRRGLLEQALPYAQALGCRRLHVMSGIAPAGAEPSRLTAQLVDNLAWAAPHAASAGVTLLIEPLNPRDMPRYLLQRQQQAHDIVAAVGSPNVAVQFDLYHCQIAEGDLTTRLRRHLDPSATTRVGHLQIAGVPDRHEPDSGELSLPHLCALIDALGWSGWVGAEYRPRRATRDGLGWFADARRAAGG